MKKKGKILFLVLIDIGLIIKVVSASEESFWTHKKHADSSLKEKQYTKALEQYRKVVNYLEIYLPNQHVAKIVESLNGIGHCFLGLGDSTEAAHSFNLSLNKTRSDEEKLAKNLAAISFLCQSEGQLDLARDYLKQELELERDENKKIEFMAKFYEFSLAQADFLTAIDMCEQVLIKSESEGRKLHALSRVVTSNVGQGQYRRAVENGEKFLNKTNFLSDSALVARVQSLVAFSYFRLGDSVKAFALADKAVQRTTKDPLAKFVAFLVISNKSCGIFNESRIQFRKLYKNGSAYEANAWKNLAECYSTLEGNKETAEMCRREYKKVKKRWGEFIGDESERLAVVSDARSEDDKNWFEKNKIYFLGSLVILAIGFLTFLLVYSVYDRPHLTRNVKHKSMIANDEMESTSF